MDISTVPFGLIKTVTIDMGNTIVSLNYELLKDYIGIIGIISTSKQIKRAEIVARLKVASMVQKGESSESALFFTKYYEEILSGIGVIEGVQELAIKLNRLLKNEVKTEDLWSNLLDRSEEALINFQKIGLKIIVISNSDGTVKKQLIRQGLEKYFDGIIDSYIVGVEKPNPAIFYLAAAKYNFNTKEALHIGDNYYTDIIGAQKAMMYSILLDPYDAWKGYDCPKCNTMFEVSKLFVDHRNFNKQS